MSTELYIQIYTNLDPRNTLIPVLLFSAENSTKKIPKHHELQQLIYGRGNNMMNYQNSGHFPGHIFMLSSEKQPEKKNVITIQQVNAHIGPLIS